MTRTPAARGHRHLFVGRPRQLRVAMNRGSAARTALFCHVWVMQASISKCSQLRGCSDWLRLWVVSRTRLRSRLHVWPLHWPAAPVPDQHSACHGYCRADLDVARAGTLPAHLFHRLVLMRTRVVVLKICATIYSDHRDLGRLQISARAATRLKCASTFHPRRGNRRRGSDVVEKLTRNCGEKSGSGKFTLST